MIQGEWIFIIAILIGLCIAIYLIKKGADKQ